MLKRLEVVVIPAEALEAEGLELPLIQRRVKLELLILTGPIINVST